MIFGKRDKIGYSFWPAFMIFFILSTDSLKPVNAGAYFVD